MNGRRCDSGKRKRRDANPVESGFQLPKSMEARPGAAGSQTRSDHPAGLARDAPFSSPFFI